MHLAPLILVAHMVTQINTGPHPDPLHSTLQQGIVTEMNRSPIALTLIIRVYMISAPIRVVV
jgi:hypothetical protein